MNSEGIRKVEQIEGLTDADYNLISARIFEFDDKRVSNENNMYLMSTTSPSTSFISNKTHMIQLKK